MSTNQDLIALLQKQIRSLQAQNESLRNQLAAERKGVDHRDEAHGYVAHGDGLVGGHS